jgi:conjugal transfer pilus assembly protein TraF
LIATPGSAYAAQTAERTADLRRGYWWYQAPEAEAKEEPSELAKPSIPPMAELATWTPPKIRKLIEDQRDYAATVLTVEAVTDFWRLEDFARRKARAFAGITQIAMLQNPELNSKSANPMVGDARAQLSAEKDTIRTRYLRAHANEFALVMFSRAACGYCRVQWPIVQRFQDETGWQVTRIDLDQRPETGARFGVEVTPTTMLIRRGSAQRMIVAMAAQRGSASPTTTCWYPARPASPNRPAPTPALASRRASRPGPIPLSISWEAVRRASRCSPTG